MRSTRAAVFLGPDRPLEIRQFDRPELESGEAWIRVECCTVCGSDLHTIRGHRVEPIPSILGHEAVGVVDEVGSPAPLDVLGEPLHAGDRVTWSVVVSCGECDRCLRGLSQKCRSLAKYGHAPATGRFALSGGMAGHLLLRKGSAVVRVPAELPAETVSPASCATATVAAAFRDGEEIVEGHVLILGAGMLGLTAAAWARSRDAASVTVVDVNEQRLALARAFGADRAIVWSDDPDELRARLMVADRIPGFDRVLELSGSTDAVEAAVRLAAVGGRVALVGSTFPSRPGRVDPEGIVRRCLTIRGVHNYAPADLSSAVIFLSGTACSFPFADLVAASFPLEKAEVAVQEMSRLRAVRVAIIP